MPYDAGDIIAKLKLDKTGFNEDAQKSLKILYDSGKASAFEYKETMSKIVDGVAVQHDNSIKKMIDAQGRWVDVSNKQSGMWSKDWWKRFGEVAIGFTLAYRAMNLVEDGLRKLVGFFISGRQAIDDFKIGIVEIAASLQALSKVPTNESFKAYLEYAKWAYGEVETISVKHFANAQQIQTTMTELATQGIVASTSKQLEAVANLTDFIIINTRGVADVSSQLRTETEALAMGEERRGAIAIRRFAATIPGFKEELKQINQINDVNEKSARFLELVEKGTVGISAAMDEVLGTHKAWLATLDTIVKKIQRLALAEMYKDILGVLIGIKETLFKNNELTEKGKGLVSGLRDTWAIFYSLVRNSFVLLKDVFGLVSMIFSIGKDESGRGGIMKTLIGISILIDLIATGLETIVEKIKAIKGENVSKLYRDILEIPQGKAEKFFGKLSPNVRTELERQAKEYETEAKGARERLEKIPTDLGSRIKKLIVPMDFSSSFKELDKKTRDFLLALRAGGDTEDTKAKKQQGDRNKWINDIKELKDKYQELLKVQEAVSKVTPKEDIELSKKLAEARAKSLQAPKGLQEEYYQAAKNVIEIEDAISKTEAKNRLLLQGQQEWSNILDDINGKIKANQTLLDLIQKQETDPAKLDITLKRLELQEKYASKLKEISEKTGESYEKLLSDLTPILEKHEKLQDTVKDILKKREDDNKVIEDANKLYNEIEYALRRTQSRAAAGQVVTESDISHLSTLLGYLDEFKEKLTPISEGAGGIADGAKTAIDKLNTMANDVKTQFPIISNETLKLREQTRWKIEVDKKLLAETQSMTAGMKVAFQELGMEEKSWGEMWCDITEKSITTVSDSMTDFLDNMLVQGKTFGESFTSLWRSISKTIARIYIEEMTKMFMANIGLSVGGGATSGMGGAAPFLGLLAGSSLFGGGTAAAGGFPASVVSAGHAPVSFGLPEFTSIFHGGGIVGKETKDLAYVSPLAFMGAPRFHDGLASDEYPAILKHGEGVFTPEQMQTLGGISINVPISVPFDNKRMAAELRTEIENGVPRIVESVIRRHS